MDVYAALKELEQSALVEVTTSGADQQEFLGLPLAASLFGRRKLEADPLAAGVEADVRLLRAFGAIQEGDVRHGIRPRVERLFQEVATRVSVRPEALEEYVPVLKFVAANHAPGWLSLADLFLETDLPDAHAQARRAIQRYLEHPAADQRTDALKHLAEICRLDGDLKGELHAWSLCAHDGRESLDVVSSAASRVNGVLRNLQGELEQEEKRVIVERVVKAFEAHITACDATDLSRLAWIHLNLQEREKARKYTQMALVKDGGNHHILGLAERLGIPT